MHTARSITLEELAAESGVTERQIRSFIHQKLMPGPSGAGRGARYGESHLAALRAIRHLREAEGLGFTEILTRLTGAAGGSLLQAAAAAARADEDQDAALPLSQYVANVRASLHEEGAARMPMMPPAATLSAALPAVAGAGEHGAVSPRHWYRIAVSPDVELHIRGVGRPRDIERYERLAELVRSKLLELGSE